MLGKMSHQVASLAPWQVEDTRNQDRQLSPCRRQAGLSGRCHTTLLHWLQGKWKTQGTKIHNFLLVDIRRDVREDATPSCCIGSMADGKHKKLHWLHGKLKMQGTKINNFLIVDVMWDIREDATPSCSLHLCRGKERRTHT